MDARQFGFALVATIMASTGMASTGMAQAQQTLKVAPINFTLFETPDLKSCPWNHADEHAREVPSF